MRIGILPRGTPGVRKPACDSIIKFWIICIMNIAFLTCEYITETGFSGGLATYLYRMASALRDSGHTPEVFVFTRGPGLEFQHEGILIHRVGRWSGLHRLMRTVMRPVQNKRYALTHRLCESLNIIAPATALARALEARAGEVPFRLVQSADYLASGLRVSRRQDRVHLIRCSTAADLYSNTDGDRSSAQQVRVKHEFQSMRGADRCYAPSRLVAEHFVRNHGIKVEILRPPVFVEKASDALSHLRLPARFLLHFGQLRPRKGTWVLAHALKLAWQVDPSVTMVWAGECCDEEFLLRCRGLWGDHASRVQLTGALARPELYTVLERAEAAVLPSLMDNLPNTVIESLVRGVPVVGTRGSSIEELVEENTSGHLVPAGNPVALSEAILRVWQGRSAVPRRFHWNSAMAKEMEPPQAVANLLRFAGLENAR